MIDVKNVTKVFNRDRPDELRALRDVSLRLNGCRATVLRGPSGSGKTTLLSLIGCMARPTAGRIFIRGKEVSSLPERFLTEVRRKTFGFIFQQLNLIRGITALENIMLPGYPTGKDFHELRKSALDLLAMLSISHRARAKIEYLSGGEAQRVAIARALINNPDFVIADEPTAHLDTKLSLDFMDTMESLKRSGKIILFASHDPLVCDSRIVDRVVEIRDGTIAEQGG